MNPQEIQDRLAGDFEFLESWEDKYQHIIDLGRELPPMAEEHRREENKVRGCQSQVWLHAEMRDGLLWFEADSDALIVKGLVSLLMKVYNGQPPALIVGTPLNLIDRIGLSSNLSPTRSNGLASMVKQIMAYAAAYSSKDASG